MSTRGDRLRLERQRLGFTQVEFAEIGGVQKRAQINYESNSRAPDADYLAAIQAVGADVAFILSGAGDQSGLTNDELELLALFRKAPLAVKAAAVGALKSGSANAVGISIGGRVEGQVVQGDLHQRDLIIGPKGRVKKEK